MQLNKIHSFPKMIVLLMFAALNLAACESRHDKADKAYGAAQQYVAAGNLAAAGAQLRSAVQMRDDIPDIWLLLGQVEQRLGNLREAYLAYGRADELRPGDPETLRALSYSAYVVGRSSQAGEAADRLLVLVPDDANGQIIKGLLALDDGDTKAALKRADTILAANPNDQTGLLLKTRALAASGETDNALAIVREAGASAGPSTDLAMLSLQIYRVRGDVDGLRTTFPALLAKDPDNADLYVDYANFLYKTGDYPEARRIITDGLLKQRRNGPYIAWAFSVIESYEPLDKPPHLDPRIATAPASTLRSVAARYLLDRGDAAGAAALVAPKGIVDITDRSIYAAAIDALGRRAEAKTIVDDILAKPDSQDAVALMLRARWALNARKYERAIIDSQAAAVADPTSASARLLLARAYSESGVAPRAGRVLIQAANELPRDRRVLRALLEFLHHNGDRDAALGAMRTFADANANNPGSWTMLATICREQGNTACVATAQTNAQEAATNFDMPNPSRPNLQRGLFSPLKRKKTT